MIQVVDLFCQNTIDGDNLYINWKHYSTTQFLFKPSRTTIFKVTNINTLQYYTHLIENEDTLFFGVFMILILILILFIYIIIYFWPFYM